MARIILFIIAAVVALVVAWVLFWHLLFLGFWVVVVVLLGFGLFRIGRWSSRRSREN
jgi:Flp pilus assembly protein TadB